MPKLRIKQVEDRVASSGIHMGKPPEGKFHRKLEPGEVVEVPYDVTVGGQPLFQSMWDTGRVDLIPDEVPVTRPLYFETKDEAEYSSPTCRTQGTEDEEKMEEARARVEARLLESSDSPPDAESPEDDKPAEVTPHTPAPPTATGGRRSRRRPTAGADNGATVPT